MAELASASPRMVPTPSTTQLESSSGPPGFFDTVPDSNAFFPPKRAQTLKCSTAKAKEKTKGVYSHDPILDRDPDELWRFLVSNLHKPHLAVHLSGTHTERMGRGSVTVVDFRVWINVFKHVIPHCTQILARRSRRASNIGHDPPKPTVRETLEEYTGSWNPFKEFRMRKVVALVQGAS